MILAATGLPFILCRTFDISARLEHQLETYTETTIWDNLPESDIAAADAQLDAFTVSLPLFLSVSLENIISSAQTMIGSWTLAAFTGRSLLPTIARFEYNGDNAYFTELPVAAQI